MSDNALPFVIRNGDWLWIPVSLLLLILWVTRPYRTGRRANRLRLRRIDKEWGPPSRRVDALRDGSVNVVAGRIRSKDGAGGHAASTVWAHVLFGLRREEVATYATDGARLELEDGTKVELVGPVRVIAGTAASADWRRREPAGVPDALPRLRYEEMAVDPPVPYPLTGRVWTVHRAVSEGAEVVVRGVAHASAGDAIDYRSNATTWSIGAPASADASGVDLRARASRLGLPRPRALWLALRLASGALVVVMLGVVVGAVAKAASGDHVIPQNGRPIELSNLSAIAIESMIPWKRKDALETLTEAISDHGYQDRESLQLAASLRVRLHACSSALYWLFQRGDFEDGLDTADRCGNVAAAGWAHLVQGEYERAAAEFEQDPDGPTLDVVWTAEVGAGHWAEAARVAARINQLAADKLKTEKDVSDDEREAAFSIPCFEDYAKIRGGDRSALDDLRTRAVSKEGGACQPLLAAFADPGDVRALARGWLLSMQERHGESMAELGSWLRWRLIGMSRGVAPMEWLGENYVSTWDALR